MPQKLQYKFLKFLEVLTVCIEYLWGFLSSEWEGSECISKTLFINKAVVFQSSCSIWHIYLLTLNRYSWRSSPQLPYSVDSSSTASFSLKKKATSAKWRKYQTSWNQVFSRCYTNSKSPVYFILFICRAVKSNRAECVGHTHTHTASGHSSQLYRRALISLRVPPTRTLTLTLKDAALCPDNLSKFKCVSLCMWTTYTTRHPNVGMHYFPVTVITNLRTHFFFFQQRTKMCPLWNKPTLITLPHTYTNTHFVCV